MMFRVEDIQIPEELKDYFLYKNFRDSGFLIGPDEIYRSITFRSEIPINGSMYHTGHILIGSNEINNFKFPFQLLQEKEKELKITIETFLMDLVEQISVL